MRAATPLAFTLCAVAFCHGAAVAPARAQGRPPGPPSDYLARIPEPPDVDRVQVGGGPTLTLGQVIAAAERHHPNVVMATQMVRAVEGDLLAAEGGFDLGLAANAWLGTTGYYQYGYGGVRLDQPTPFWGTTFSAGWRFGRAFDESRIPGYGGGVETLDAGELWVGVRVPLWQDGPTDARRARLWQAEHLRDAAQLDYDARMIALRLGANMAYWQWVAAGQRYLVQERLLALAEERDGQIRQRVTAGAIPAIEALENQRVILARRRSLVGVRRDLERTGYALSLFLRGDDGAPRVPPHERLPVELAAMEPLGVTFAEALERAWARRPDLARYRALAERRRVALQLAENRFAPRVDLSLRGSVDIGDGTDDQLRRLADPMVEGSVLLSFPLQFREARGGIARERADLESLLAEAQLVRERVAAEVQDAWSAVRAAEEGVRLADASAQVARSVAEAERQRFDLGATQLFIVNLREQAAAEAEVELVNAEVTLRLARAQWDAAIASGVGGP